MELGAYAEKRTKYVVEWDLRLGPMSQLEDLVAHADIVGPIEVKALGIDMIILVDPHTDLDALVDAFADSSKGASSDRVCRSRSSR